tara:strand:- start:151 stop:1971 length:1821 start_codon:yes stop_codon:yes gene_type:complete
MKTKLIQTKKILITIILAVISLTLFSQTSYLWQKTYSSGKDIYYNTSPSNSDEYIMISNILNSLDTNKITRFNSLGEIILQKSFIDTVGVVHSIIATEKNTFLLGGWKYDQNLKYHIALMEIDNNLDTIWQKTYSSGSSHESFRDFVTTQDSGFVVLARSWTNGGAISLIKLNSSGNIEWSEMFGSTVDYSPGVLLPKDDGYNIVGTILNGGGNTDFFIIKTDLNGKTKWTKKIESTETEGLQDAQLMNNGNILISGRSINSSGFSSLLLVMTDSLANILWSKTYSNSGAFLDTYSDIEIINDSTIIAVGIEDSWTSISSPLSFVQNIDTSGSVRWTKLIKQDQLSLKQVIPNNYNSALILGEITSPTNNSIQDIYIENSSLDLNFIGCSDSLVTAFEIPVSFTTDTITLDSVNGTFQATNITDWNLYLSSYNDSLLCSICNNFTASGFTYSDSLLTVNFSDTISGSTSWYWNFGDGNTDTTQNPSHTYSSPGTYNVCLSVSNICNSDTICDSVTVIITGINELINENQVKVFPNPFSKTTNLQMSVELKNATLNIYNSFGQVVKTINNISGNSISIQRDNLVSGIYFFQLRDKNKKLLTGRIIIE